VPDRILIVARLEPGNEPEVAKLFAASDATELPHLLGVTSRHLYTYQGLYFQHVQFAGDAQRAMAVARPRADFQQLCDDLGGYVTPFDPATWRSPADAMAKPFYAWSPGNSSVPPRKERP